MLRALKAVGVLVCRQSLHDKSGEDGAAVQKTIEGMAVKFFGQEVSPLKGVVTVQIKEKPMRVNDAQGRPVIGETALVKLRRPSGPFVHVSPDIL